MNAVFRWILILVALLALGPVAGWLIGSLRDVSGGNSVTLLLNTAPASGLLRGLAVVGIAGILGMLGTAAFSRDTGMTAAGLVIAWAAWRTATLEDVLRTWGQGVTTKLAVEGLLCGAAALVLGVLIQKLSQRRKEHAGEGLLLAGAEDEVKPGPVIAASLGAAIIAGGAVAWLTAMEALKGQSVIAALLAGLAAGAAAQVVASGMRARAGIVIPLIAMLVVACVAPIIAQVLHGSKIIDAAMAGKVFSAARPISLDWAAGGLLGIPIGLGWASSMLEKTHPETA